MIKQIKSSKVNPDVSSVECKKQLLPVRDSLDILNGKWKLPIIIALSFGRKRFKVIEREVKGITAKMLSKELKDLEMNKLVKRTVYDTKPVTVEYELTEYGKTLDDVIDALRDWGVKHRNKILGKPKK
ncbi:MAG: helix-turn-helix transcriptional regulator [Ignavibacteriae bacterium]|nr:helix-turn-helix transcriptional regulator [Ignavibacteriota bacterium]MCB0723152.1 helix-turn-helix transcriptional regulator [Ignavibacteriota bacterium]MCB9242998.1 helix-turn-helix transcriptional regulator [Ignavibacteriales bacterium]